MTLAAVTKRDGMGWDGYSADLEHSEEEENHVNKNNQQIRSQAANRDQELNSRVEFLQLLSLPRRTEISTGTFCCAHVMTMPCASSQPGEKKTDK